MLTQKVLFSCWVTYDNTNPRIEVIIDLLEIRTVNVLLNNNKQFWSYSKKYEQSVLVYHIFL